MCVYIDVRFTVKATVNVFTGVGRLKVWGHVVGMSPSHSDHFIIFIGLLTSGATPPRPVPDSCVVQIEEQLHETDGLLTC